MKKSKLKREITIKFENNSNPFEVMVENKLDSVNSVPVDIAFKLSNYKQ